MQITKIEEHIHLVDLQSAGIKNYVASYVLKGKNTAVVETGPTSTIQNLLSSLQELDVKPDKVAYVAVSHIHLDHAGAAGILMEHLPKAKLIAHSRGAPHIANPEKLWAQSKQVLGRTAEIYGKPEPVPEERIIAATDGLTFDIGNNIKIKAVETLGHASHHLAYYETLSRGVFTGDAAGIYLPELDLTVPTTPPGFRLDIALQSLEKLINIKPSALYYSHFGEARNSLQNLQQYKKQLKIWAKAAKEGIKEREDLEAIRKRILQSDANLQKALEHIKNHPTLSKTVLHHSVQGITKFVEKFGNFRT